MRGATICRVIFSEIKDTKESIRRLLSRAISVFASRKISGFSLLAFSATRVRRCVVALSYLTITNWFAALRRTRFLTW